MIVDLVWTSALFINSSYVVTCNVYDLIIKWLGLPVSAVFKNYVTSVTCQIFKVPQKPDKAHQEQSIKRKEILNQNTKSHKYYNRIAAVWTCNTREFNCM